jgi:hypothetical protein
LLKLVVSNLFIMDLKDLYRVLVGGLLILLSCKHISCSPDKYPLAGKPCTTREDIPIIKVTSYTTVVPLEDPKTNNMIFSRFSMAKRLLNKESRPVRNVTVETMDLCLGEGGLREWSIPVSSSNSFVSEVVIECFDQGMGPVEFEYNGLGVRK